MGEDIELELGSDLELWLGQVGEDVVEVFGGDECHVVLDELLPEGDCEGEVAEFLLEVEEDFWFEPVEVDELAVLDAVHEDVDHVVEADLVGEVLGVELHAARDQDYVQDLLEELPCVDYDHREHALLVTLLEN